MVIKECYLAPGVGSSLEAATTMAQDNWANFKTTIAEGLGAPLQDTDEYVQVEAAVPNMFYDAEHDLYHVVLAVTYSYNNMVSIGGGVATSRNDDY